MNGYRGLDSNKGLLGKLSKGGSLYEITKRVKENNDYWMGIRDNRVMVYYMGGKILEISEKGSLSFDTKYIDHYDKTLQISKKFESTQDWISKEKLLRTAIENFQKNNKKNEKIAQQEIMLKNNNAEDAEWFLVDMEYAVSGNPYGRFDMIGITKKPDINGKHRIALIELKTGTNAFGGANANRYGSGIAGHINNFYEFLCGEGGKGKDNVENLAKEIACILSNYTALGIDIGGLQLSLDDIDCSPENVDCIIMCSDIQDKSYATRQVKKYVFNDKGASIYCLENKWGKNFRNKYRRLNVYLSIVDKERVIKGKMFEKLTRKRAELHLHTTMSTMDGVSTPIDYINAALFGEQGHPMLSAIAITDHASVHAFPDAYREIKRLQSLDVNLKLIYGNEIYMTDKEETYHTSILVINKIGLKNLYKLVSLANTEYFDKVPKTPKSELKKYRKGLLIGSGCDAGELYHAVREGKTDDELIEIVKFYDYLEVVPTGNFEYYIEQGYVKDREALISINKKIIEIGEMAKKPVVAVSDAHYVCAEDMICRKILMQHKGYENYDTQPLLSVRTTDEMLAEFSCLPEKKAYEIVVKNTNEIANMVDAEILPIDIEAHYEADIKELEDLVYKKLHEKYGKNIPQEFLNRTEQELSVIGEIQSNVYLMLISFKLVEMATEKGWTVGNRGSVASSYIAYLLGITEINPLDAHYYCPKCHYVEFHNEYSCGVDMGDKMCKCGEKLEKDGFTIPYETFLDTDGSREIDIDLNFSPEYQKEAFENLKKLAGSETVRCGAIGTISYKAARAMVNQYCKAEEIKLDKYQKEEIADKLSYVKRSTGMHPGGMLLIPHGKEICNYTPLQYPADCSGFGYVTHFDYHSIDRSTELKKLDILAHDTPSMLRQLEELTGTKSKDIPLDDEKTMKLFSDGKTLGIPEFGTDYVRECVMDKVKTYSFDNLIRISALSHGTDVWYDNGGNLVSEGKALSDIVSCRDDVMLYLISQGIEREEAYKISERIRKGKGLTGEQYDMLINEGVENWRLDSWNKIKYSFPRAHAASYVLLSYRVAYYKAHFPLEFYCAYFNIHSDDFDAGVLINNAKELLQEIKKMEETKELSAQEQYLLTYMKVCQEMYDAGYTFDYNVNKTAKIKEFEITHGRIRPIFA